MENTNPLGYKKRYPWIRMVENLIYLMYPLEDAYYQLPDYNANSGGKSSLDGARCDVSYLLDEVERTILDENRVLSGEELEEVMNHPPVSLL